MTLVTPARFQFILSTERAAAIETLIASGDAFSIQHALLLEAARYVRLPT